ncbi:hypothetical protein BDA99DRAFT_537535 [Phascolomyces articulosus]|uniref:Heterokaryon incompatibility domain-containing protein n=1 Tax=Phascolomyces articulosus TaxID=60185 RepID=A0AAD5PFB3_9FUNG|nr:hypothetical protein BDA99DRAFT_537535 [Phascolomyces articulosus]
MYFTYYHNQTSVDLADTSSYRNRATSGTYQPKWLIRVSDWVRVPGSDATNGYCALSYRWRQAGDIVQNDQGKDQIVDKGKHCIVEEYNRDKNDRVELKRTTNEREEIEDAVRFLSSPERTVTVKYVTYEKLLHKICTDFQIDYLWYDKAYEEDGRIDEIEKIPELYNSARFTIAMVPEFRVDDGNNGIQYDMNHMGSSIQARYSATRTMFQSLWWKSSWTLREIISSKHILVVGSDTNMWQHSLHSCRIPTIAFSLSDSLLDFKSQEAGGTVNQVLSEAHFRTSSKPHDIIFTLVDIFPELCNEIEVNYEIDEQTVFNMFYSCIADKLELSILCFGSNRSMDGGERRVNTVRGYKLPSWTGAAGLHPSHAVTTTKDLFLESYQVNRDTMEMYIATKNYWKIPVTRYEYGCFSIPEMDIDKKHRSTQYKKFKKDRLGRKWLDPDSVTQNDVLIEWDVNMTTQGSCTMTHYHQHQDDKVTRLRPLSLTEDCEECFVLPILLELHKGAIGGGAGDRRHVSLGIIDFYIHVYFLPVFKRCNTSNNNNNSGCSDIYKAVGVYLVGISHHEEPTFRWNHCIGKDDIHTHDPEEILNILFENDCHENPKEFTIV